MAQEGLKKTHIHEEGGNAYERTKRMLEAADIDPEDVMEIEVSVTYGSDGDSGEVVSVGGMVSETPYAEEAAPDPNIEYGPTEPSGEMVGSSGSKKRGGLYNGNLPPTEFEGEAVRPDSIQGEVLEALSENQDQWFHRSEVASLVDIDKHQASNAMTRLFNDHGYLKRRKIEPQPNKKGLQREYAITETGRASIAEGKRRAEGIHEEKKEEMEEAE